MNFIYYYKLQFFHKMNKTESSPRKTNEIQYTVEDLNTPPGKDYGFYTSNPSPDAKYFETN